MKSSLIKSDLLKGLKMKHGTRQVLVALSHLGRSPVADISTYLNTPKSTIYDGLDFQVRREHFNRSGN